MPLQNSFEITADLKKTTHLKEPHVMQNDDITFVVSIKNDELDFLLTDVTTATLANARLDKVTIVTPGVISLVDKTVTFNLGTNETAVTGRVDATVQLYDASGRVSTVNFSYKVSKDPTGSGFIPSEVEQTLIQVVLNDGPLRIQEAVNAGVFATDQGNYAKAQGDYVESQKPIIDTFTGEQTNLQSQIDVLVVDGDSSPESAQARVGSDATIYPTLKARLDAEENKTTTLLADNARKIGETNSEVLPYEIATFNTAFLNGKTSDQVINEFFEPLRIANPTYATRTLLGKDQSGLYDIHKYVLEPENYTKTLMIDTAMHSSEITFLATMYELCKRLCDVNDTENTYINYLRNNVKIIYIPILNPWGFNQTSKTRWNSRGVNINRNTSYVWNSFVGDPAFGNDHKGSAVFSEIESQYLKQSLDNDGIDLFLDLHNLGVGSPYSYLTVLHNECDISNSLEFIFNELKTYNKLATNISLQYNATPNFANYAWESNSIYSLTLEFADGNFGAMYSNVEINKSVEYLLSVIKASIKHVESKAKAGGFDVTTLESPVDMDYYYWNNSSTDISFSTTALTEILKFRIDLSAEERINGYVEVDFDISYQANNAATITSLGVRIDVLGNGAGATQTPDIAFCERYSEGSARHTLHVRAVAFVTDLSYPVIKFYGSANTGSVRIMKVRGTVKRTKSKTNKMININGSSKEANVSGSVFI